jgi:AraC-like DNA-binding protein
MESTTREEEILVSPPTDFKSHQPVAPQAEPTLAPSEPAVTIPPPAADDIERRIASESEWRGSFIREVREIRGVSLEELAEFTKISRTYLRAIENEEYDKLPVVVYVRGFLAQIARKLRLPQDKLVKAYMTRFREKAPEKC